MKSLTVVALSLFMAACAIRHPELHVGVVVEPIPKPCFDSAGNGAITISITNGASIPLAFSASANSGPPYSLHPWAFDVVTSDGTPPNSKQWGVILADFWRPSYEVRLDPGDRAEFHAFTTFWPTSEYPGKVKLRVRDTDGYLYESNPVPVCASNSAPNYSFQRTLNRYAASRR